MTSSVSEIQELPVQEVVFFPASSAQQRLWFLDQLTPGRATYNLPEALRIRGKLDMRVLERTLEEVARRHETLRTRFVAGSGEPQQVIEDWVNVQLPVLDLTGVAGEEAREAEAMRLAQEEARTPFNLQQAPLFRGKLLRLSELDHVLLFTMHHIISDAWSMGVLVEEVSVLYGAFSAGQPSPLPELPIQYADYSVWQRECLEGGLLEPQLAYWKQQLAETSVLHLPTDLPRPISQSQNGATCSFVIDANLTQGLKKLGEEQGATLFMVLLAVFQTLLYRYSGQEDIAVGTPVAGRRSSETEKLIGFFVNTLVLRGDLSGGLSFIELLQRTKEVTLGAYAHQDLPFDKLVEVLSPERDLGSTPLFQVMIVLQNAPDSDLRLCGAVLEPFGVGNNATSKFDLTLLQAEEKWGRLISAMEYNTDLFDAATISRMIEHYQMLLKGIVEHPEQPIAWLLLLTAKERKRVVEDWNLTENQGLLDKCLHELFEEQVARTPRAVAVVNEYRQVSYEELNRQANQMAHYLMQLGVGPDVAVGLCMEPSIEMVMAVLGILKAGGAYVPLDPEYPAERLAYMMRDAQLNLLLTQGQFRDILAGFSGHVVCVDTQHLEKVLEESDANPERSDVNPENLAYVLYTSGSTGKPKGVGMTQRPLCNLVRWQIMSSPGPKRTLQFSPLTFDLSFYAIFATLGSGGSLVLIDHDTRRDPSQLWKVVCEREIEKLFLPFIALQGLAEVACVAEWESTALREVISTAEQLKVTPALRRFFDRLGGAILDNEYGPTETHVVTAHRLQANSKEWPLLPPIGKPIANDQVYVLDENDTPSPIGVPGSLYLAGVGLARGYLNRPDLTAERFLPNPLSVCGGERMYRTGDLARWLPEGNLEFLGRMDHQVKIRGFRIELGEIEAALQEHGGVRQAVVIAREDETGDKRLVAYVVPEQEDEESTNGSGRAELRMSELREYLLGKLPEYMVPSAYVQLEALPLNHNGKVDRKNLPQADKDTPEQEYVGPRNATEETLCRLWEEVLRRERVGIHDNFFKSGGHSLLAARVAARMRESLNVEIPLRRMFESPTIAQLAEVIDQMVQTSGVNGAPLQLLPGIKRAGEFGKAVMTSSVSDIQQLPVQEVVFFPASSAQQRLWFLDQLTPGKATYNLPGALRVRGKLDLEVLKRTVEEIVRRHETLRTRFVAAGDEPQQVIEDRVNVQLPVLDLTGVAGEEEREAEAMGLAQEEARTPFDLQQAPLFRGKLLRLGELNHVLLFTMHHIISDAWSIGILVEEVSVLYGAFSAGRPSPLPDLPIQYADYSVWQRECLEGGLLEPQLIYWRQQLEGVGMLQLPTDRPRPPAQSQNGATCEFVIAVDLTQKLKKLAEEQGATLFMVVLAAFQTLLYRCSGQDDIAVGTPVAGRRSSETEKLIGFFINTLVLRGDLSGAPTFIELLQRTKEVTLDAYAHQDVPFEKLVEVLSPERNLGSTPLFQAMIVLQNAPQSDLQLGTAALQLFNTADNGTSKFDLSLFHAEEETGRLTGSMEYNTDVFEAATIRRLVGHYSRLLNSIAAVPQAPIPSLEILSGEERRLLLEDFNPGATTIPGKTITELFEEQVERTPEAKAVQYQEESLSYIELNQRANHLGHYLKQMGVKADERVAICVERSVEMVVGMLGILKAGGAYVPLDPGYPQERLSYMVKDAGVKLLLVGEGLQGRVAAPGIVEVMISERQWKEIGRESGSNVECRTEAENLAYVMYTSGSTGEPKGIGIPHRGVVRLVRGNDYAELGADEVMLQMAPVSFDASTLEIWGSLLNGGKLVVMAAGKPTLEEVSRVLEREKVSTLWLTAGIFHAMVDEQVEGLRAVRQVLAGGDVLSPTHVERFLEWSKGSGRKLINGYGPTENTTFTCCHGMEEYVADGRTVPIGRPIANTRVYVLDEWMQPVPVGVVGELYIGGDGLARGYIGQGKLTAEKFVPHPFSEAGGERLYRSGDLCRWRENGELEFIGRNDHQVKIRGHRIELGEIEVALQEHGGLRQAVVLVRGDEKGDKQLVAYVVPEPEGEESDNGSIRAGMRISDLRELLLSKLPEYMVPSVYVELEKIPLTFNGKVDRRALAASAAKELRDEAGYMPPRTPEEKILAEIWADAFGLDRVGIHDNFFKLGGHSLLAIRVIARMRTTLGVEVPMKVIFEAPTIAAIAEKLRNSRMTHRAVTPPPIVRSSRENPIPLSFAQQRLWLLDQLEPGNRVHHIPTLVRLKGALNIEVLSAALNEIVRRHEILRTSFPATDGHPYQMISPPAPVLLEKVDLRNVLQEVRDETLQKYVDLHTQEPFDLAHGPLFRVALYIVEKQHYVLCLTVHHIICDAWSVPLFIREINILYSAFLNGKASPLPELPLQYADVAAWERGWLRDEVLEHHIQYWRQTLEGAPQTLDLPTDFPRPSTQSFDAEVRMLRLSPELSSALKDLSHRLDATEFMTLLALMNVWLFRYSGQSDILIGTPVSNRTPIETEALIGIFINTLVFRTRIDANAAFVELVNQVRLNALAAYAHQALPFERLVEELHVVRDPARNPLFQVMLNMLAGISGELDFGGSIESEAMQTDSGQARFDIHLNAFSSPAGLDLAITYKRALFRQSTITSMLETFAELVRLIVGNPEITISELIETSVRFEQESALARKRDHSQQQAQQLRTVRRRAAMNQSR